MAGLQGFKDLVVETKGEDFRVHRSVFVSDEVLERERNTVFAKNWVYVGHVSEVPNPGDFITRTVVGERLIMTRADDGEIRVLFNSCRHRGALVCREREGNTKQFRCFYHAWTYTNSGELVGVTERKSFPPGFDRTENGLLSPRFEIYRDFVFAAFTDQAPGLADYLAPVRPYLDAVIDQSLTGQMEILKGAHLYRMGGNWKLIVENSIDGYHGLPVHQTYFKYLGQRGYDLTGALAGVGRELGNGHAVLEYNAPFGRSVARPAPIMDEHAVQRVKEIEAELVAQHGPETADLITQKSKNILVYPNLLVIDAASLQLRTLDPVATDYTEVSAWCLGPVGEDAELRKHRIEGYLEFLGPGGFATPDDNEAIESCQEAYGRLRGAEWSIVSKGIHKEVPSTTDEEQVRAFWRQWQSDLVGLDAAQEKGR